MHPLFNLFAKTSGRLRRRTYWIGAIALTIAFAALFTLLENTFGRTSTLILYPPFLWSAFALMMKRLHDGAKSGWWLLIAIIPAIGPALLLLWLCFGRGIRGENQFGDDPRLINADYLTVRIGA